MADDRLTTEFVFTHSGHVYRLEASLPTSLSQLAADHLDGSVFFAFHRNEGDDPDEVLALSSGTAYRSRDLGETWTAHAIQGFENARFANGFITSSGSYILQERGWNPAAREVVGDAGRIVVLDPDFNPLAEARNGVARWLSSRSIAEAHGTIMYADYQRNPGRNTPMEAIRIPSTVFRSRDGGLTWEAVFTTDRVRHFHVLVPDPDRPRVWWLTSGDEPDESRVWTTEDDGDTWQERTEQLILLLHDAGMSSQAALRTTDLSFCESAMIWGADDFLRTESHTAGSCLVHLADRCALHGLRITGRPGPEIRNLLAFDDIMLVFAGATRSRSNSFDHPTIWTTDRAGLGPTQLIGHAPNSRTRRSALTYSCMSRVPTGGVFFSFRGSHDMFGYHPLRIVRWELRRES